ncbi:hypothetical protein Tco_1359224 [Tanacetum coccineum]
MKNQGVRHRLFTVVPAITSMFTTTIPLPPPFFNPLPQQATPTPTTSEDTTSFPSLLDFSSVFKFNDKVTNLEKDLSKIKQVDQEEAQAEKRDYIELVDTSMRVVLKEEKNVTESLEAAVLARSSSQPKSTYEVAASLSEFELTKILIDKMEKNKSYNKADYKRELYDALVKSYQTDKDLFDTYGKVFTLKRSQDDRDKDQDLSAGSDRGTKKRSQARNLHMQRSQVTQLTTRERNRIKSSTRNKRQHVDSRPPQTWISQVARTKEPRTSFDELIGTSFDFSAFVLNRLNIKDLTQEILNVPRPQLNDSTGITLKENLTKTKAATYEIKWIEDLVRNLWSPMKVIYDKHAYWGPKHQYFYGFAANMSSSKDVYSRKRIIAVTRLMIMKKYDYGHLEEIEVCRDDQKLYKFREDPKGVIYKDQNNKNRLMRADELHKFSDCTLNDVRTVLHDIAKGIRMKYLPKRKWSGLDKRRARVMVQDTDKQLYERRLMPNLKKFIGGREYRNDLRLLERNMILSYCVLSYFRSISRI